jgi:hypothetical protein
MTDDATDQTPPAAAAPEPVKVRDLIDETADETGFTEAEVLAIYRTMNAKLLRAFKTTNKVRLGEDGTLKVKNRLDDRTVLVWVHPTDR